MVGDDSASEARVGSLVDGRLRLVKLLGVGATGAVYSASFEDGRQSGFVAVKLLLAKDYAPNAQLFARFLREGRVIAQLEDPNLTRVYDLGIDETTQTPFFVMELLDGTDLGQLSSLLGPVRPTTVARIARQAARGLAVAHRASVIHHDIKPSNIFLHRDGETVVVKVCDFGVAKAIVDDVELGLTETGQLFGSPIFSSPEQLRNSKHVDPRSDLWSLGMTLWMLLAGRAAMAHDSLTELIIDLQSGKIPWLQDVAPWIDPELARLVHSLLLHDVTLRCPSADALVVALGPFVGGNDALSSADLVGLSVAERATFAPKGAKPSSWQELEASAETVRAEEVDPELTGLVGVHLAGRYRLDRILGVGGMGGVFHATAPNGEEVAVKIILGEQKRLDMLSRFVREARATMAIDSPNVVRIREVDADPQRNLPFIVMELLRGTDLDRLVKRGALLPETTARLFSHACAGLAAAHSRGIVHRDVKPANLFLHEPGDGSVQLKICDFGIAKQLETDGNQRTASELTRSGGMLGSPMYMSPEQARSAKHVERTTDIWSLGVALHETLSGQRLWAHCSTVGDLIIAICTEPIPSLRDAAPWLEPGLVDIVDRALQRDPTIRFPSMEAFAAALAPYTGGTLHVSINELRAISPALRTRVATVRLPTHSFGTDSQVAHARTLVDAPTPRSRRPLILAVVAVVTVLGFFVVRSVSTAPATLNDVASAVAPGSTTQPISIPTATPTGAIPKEDDAIARAEKLLLKGDDGAAHAILQGLTTDDPLRRDARYTTLENTWADHMLEKAGTATDVATRQKAALEIAQSGADETRKERARQLVSGRTTVPAPRTTATGGGVTSKPPAKPSTAPTPIVPGTTKPTTTSPSELPTRF